MKTPLQRVNEQYGGKEKLAALIAGLLGDVAASKEPQGELQQRLLAASNTKLLRLAKNAEAVKSKHGTTAKLAEAVAAGEGRAKDAPYVKRLADESMNRLLSMGKALEAKQAASARPVAAKPAKAARPAAAAKPATKKAAPKGKATKAAAKAPKGKSRK